MAQVEVTVQELSGVEVTVLDAPGAQVAIGPTLSTATPEPVGQTGAAGTSSSASKADHSHAHGNQTGTSLHALATTSGAGFMSAAQFDLLDGATDQDTASTLVKRDASGDFEANQITAELLGNAATATALETGRTINGVSFDGTANITITATPTAGSVVDASVDAAAAIALSKLATGALPSGITVASANLVDGTIVDADINASAAIALAKLAAVTAGRVVLGNASNVATATEITGDVTIDSSGVTAIAAGVIVDVDVKSDAAIAHSKLASITAGQVLLGDGSNVPTATALSGDVTIDSSGVTAIGSGVIVDADVSGSAAIAGSKISPDFGSQNITTTGVYRISGIDVVGARQTGWVAPTGTASRATFASYAGQTVSDPPTQAEVQAIDDHLKVLSETLKALIDDLTTHGLIGPTPSP